MTEQTYTRAQVTAAMGTMHGQLDAVTDTGIVGHWTTGIWRRLGSGPFTREQVQAAFNAEANELDPQGKPGVTETSDTIFTQDVLNLAVNVAVQLLDHPDAGLAEAIAASYGVPEEDGGAYVDTEAEPGTPEYDAAVVARVLGWVS